MNLGIDLFAAVLAAMSLSLGGGTSVATGSTSAHMETGDFTEFTQAGALTGGLRSTRARAYDGRRSARASYCGGGDNGFARGIQRVRWRPGKAVWYGAAFHIPHRFFRDVQGEVDLLRWDDYGRAGEDAVYGGIVIYASDHRARLVRGTYSGADADVLSEPFAVPAGRWFWLEVHQRLTEDRSARSEVFLDGRRVGASRRPNAYGTPIDRLRVGIVAIQEGRQRRPLTLWFDRVTTAAAQLGPRRTSRTAKIPRPHRRGGPARSVLGRGCGP